jgi:hypothetical protein
LLLLLPLPLNLQLNLSLLPPNLPLLLPRKQHRQLPPNLPPPPHRLKLKLVHLPQQMQRMKLPRHARRGSD